MGFLIELFNTALYKPLFNLLIVFYQYLPGKDFGLAIIVLTLFIKFLLYPLGAKAIKIQRKIQELQPQIKEIQKKYKDDKQKQGTEMLDLYKREKLNPFAGIIPSLIQLPILIALIKVFWGGLDQAGLANVYNFIPTPESINFLFLGINLAEPSSFLAVVAGVSQFWQTKTITSFNKPIETNKQPKSSQKNNPDFSEIMQKQMLYFFPVFTFFILLKLPAAIGLYWIVTALFTTFQQYTINKQQATEWKTLKTLKK